MNDKKSLLEELQRTTAIHVKMGKYVAEISSWSCSFYLSGSSYDAHFVAAADYKPESPSYTRAKFCKIEDNVIILVPFE